MSGKYEFDDTRGAIGASSMSEKERFEMLKKFKNSGGEVLREKVLHKNNIFSSEVSKVNDLKKNSNQPTLISSLKREKIKKGFNLNRFKKNKKRRKGLFHPILLNINSYFSGLTNLLGTKVTNTFATLIINELEPSLLILHGNLNYFLLGNREVMQETIQKLDEENPVFIEILNYLYLLHEVIDFTLVKEALKTNFRKNIDIAQILPCIKNIYLKLYYLAPCMLTALKALNRLYQLYTKNSSKERDICQIKVKEMIKVINQVLVPALKNYFTLICCEKKIVFESSSKDFQDHIFFDNKKKIGKRIAGAKCELFNIVAREVRPKVGDVVQENEENKKEKDDVEEENNNPIIKTKEYQYGKLLMKQLTPEKMKTKYDPHGYYKNLNNFDTIFLSFLYFKEFDFEYSPVLTTHQIHYNIDNSYGVRKDYSKILPEISSFARNIDQIFEEYYNLMEKLKKIEEDSEMHYIEQSKKKVILQKKIYYQAGIVKRGILAYLHKVVINLAMLISDMKKDKNIVVNMDESLAFGGVLDSKKKLLGKKIKECITEVYCYSLVLKCQMEDGSLEGTGLLDDLQISKIFGNTVTSLPKEVSVDIKSELSSKISIDQAHLQI